MTKRPICRQRLDLPRQRHPQDEPRARPGDHIRGAGRSGRAEARQVRNEQKGVADGAEARGGGEYRRLMWRHVAGLLYYLCPRTLQSCGLWAVGCGLWAVGCGLWAEISVVSASRHAPSDEAKRASDATLCPCGGANGLFDPASFFPD